MISDAILYTGHLALCFAVSIAAAQWRHLTSADRILAYLLILTVVQEGLSFGMIRVMHISNMITYHIYSPLELLLICLWMHRSHAWPRARVIALICGLAGCAISVLNSLFLQPTHTANTYFLLIEGAVIIQLSLTSVAGLVMREDTHPYRMVHFWVALNLIFYWSVTLVAYSMIGVHPDHAVAVYWWARLILILANILFYTSLGVILLRYKKLTPSGA